MVGFIVQLCGPVPVFSLFHPGCRRSSSAFSNDPQSMRQNSLLVEFSSNVKCLRDSPVGSRIVGLRLSFASIATSISQCVGDRRVADDVVLC